MSTCLVIFSVLLSFKGPAGHSLVVNANSIDLLATSDDDCVVQWIEMFDGNQPYTIVPRYDVPSPFIMELIPQVHAFLNLDVFVFLFFSLFLP